MVLPPHGTRVIEAIVHVLTLPQTQKALTLQYSEQVEISSKIPYFLPDSVFVGRSMDFGFGDIFLQ